VRKSNFKNQNNSEMHGRLLLVFLFVGVHAFAQPNFYFNRLTTENGLSHNKVNCIISDKRGFMWLGTDDGLNRYDGHKFTVFRNDPQNSTTISGNIITDMLEDEQENIWIATADGGITKYNYKLPPAQQFKQFKHNPANKNSIPVNIINKLLLDKQGYLWLATSGHFVLRFNRQTETFETPVKKGTRTVLSLALDKNETLWVGRQGGGLLKINTKNLQYEMDERYEDLYANLPHATVTALYNDTANKTWFGSWDKLLYQYDALQKKEIAVDAAKFNDEALCFDEDATGNLWIGGRHNGLYFISKKTGTVFQFRYDPSREGTIASNRVLAIYAAAKGMIWIGTQNGVSIFDAAQHQFEQIFLPVVKDKSITIFDFYEDDRDQLWMATSNGIYIRSLQSQELRHYPLHYKGYPLLISKFFKDSDGNFYIGTDYTVFQLNTSTFSITPLPNTEKDDVMSKIIKSHVVSFAEEQIEGQRVLLTVPYGHYLAYYHFKEQRWVSRLDSNRQILKNYQLKDNLIRKIHSSRSSKLWIATAKEGLGEWDLRNNNPVAYYKNNPDAKSSFSNNNIYDIAEDAKGNLWLSTWGGGLHYFQTTTKEVTHISGSTNLLEGIQTDAVGNVWMIGNGHLYKYDPVKKAHSSYRLPDVEKTGGVKGSIFKSRNGNLILSGFNYFIEFNPQTIREISGKPAVYFTDFKVFNESYSDLLIKNHIQLRYNQNYVTFEFAAPNYASGTQVQYQYMLEGLNKNWMDLGTENKVSFSNLDGGTYVFKVRAGNRPGVWSENTASVTLEIIPPFWKRIWFYMLCVLLVAAIVYAVYRYRISELQKKQEIRNKIAQDLHDSMGSTLSSISVYSQVAKIYKQQQKEEQLQQTLEKISETSGEMISEMNDIVWAINPRNDNMEVIVQRMESYAKPLLAAREIQFNFMYDETIKHINLEMTKRKNFYLIFKEAVNNVLKYAECRQLTVTLRTTHQELHMLIKDDGTGFDLSTIEQHKSQSLSGNGLHNMQMRAAEMKGRCTIESRAGSGTTVNLWFPIP
jgi:ligand-binding sensor domain-containing protein/two-component sensor histidine kinase